MRIDMHALIIFQRRDCYVISAHMTTIRLFVDISTSIHDAV
jgi:hypothetical protein